MRKIALITASIGILLLSCGNRQSQTDTVNEVKLPLEESETEKLFSEISEDKSFTDFFETFMWDEEFQKSRTIFPYRKDNKTIQTAKDWKHLPFYIASGYIPILSSDTLRGLYDKEVKTSKIGLYLIDFKREITDKYNFERIDSKWFLQSSESLSINKVPDFEFIDFLTKFSKDSTFQLNHILFPLLATLIDYDDDDYPFITKTIPLEDWKHLLWASINQLLVLSNIDSDNKYRNVYFRGVENGIGVEYTFEKINENWKLIRLEDYSM
jgi:hypothetical protein